MSGTGQAGGPHDLTAYGQITDFESGAGFVRFTGSCPQAYKQIEVRRFDRHVLWLQPDTYVIVDDLETPQPQTFQWMLHAANQMDVQENVVRITNRDAAGRLQFFVPERLVFEQTDRFTQPVRYWRADAQDRSRHPDQWHLSASTVLPSTQQRFVTVLQVFRRGGEDRLPRIAMQSDSRSVTVVLSDGRKGSILLARP